MVADGAFVCVERLGAERAAQLSEEIGLHLDRDDVRAEAGERFAPQFEFEFETNQVAGFQL